MNGYRHLDHPADIAMLISADSVEDLFIAGAEAWKESALESFIPESTFELHINLESISIEELLVDFLSELNFNLYARKLVYSRVKMITIKKNTLYRAEAAVYFEDFSPARHRLKNEIKAVTFHQMNIEHKNNSYSTRIIFDI